MLTRPDTPADLDLVCRHREEMFRAAETSDEEEKSRLLKMALRQDGRVLRAIAWRGAERHAFLEEHRALVDVAYSLEQNEFNGETYLELTVADVRPAETAAVVQPAAAVEPAV